MFTWLHQVIYRHAVVWKDGVGTMEVCVPRMWRGLRIVFVPDFEGAGAYRLRDMQVAYEVIGARSAWEAMAIIRRAVGVWDHAAA
ncbi:MAG: hypothetical protein ACRDPK_19180 [Carbonactinosporaceae bacterium]